MKKRVRINPLLFGVGGLMILLLVSFLAYQGYWFIRDFGKNKYQLATEEYIQPELKEQIGIVLELEVKQPKKETIVLKTKGDNLITPESLETVSMEGMKIIPDTSSNGVKIQIEKTNKKQSFKIPIPIVRDSKDTIQVYREGHKLVTTKINYTVPKKKEKKSKKTALLSNDKLYATNGSFLAMDSNYGMFRLPVVTQLNNFNPSNKKIVYNYQELVDALKNSSIDDIEFGENISGNLELPKINRSLRIDGKNFTFSSTETPDDVSRTFRLETTKTPKTFIFTNLNVDIKNRCGVIRSDELYSNDNNWLVTIENITNTYQEETGNFIIIPRASLIMTGTVNVTSGTIADVTTIDSMNIETMIRAADVFNATEILITEGAKINITAQSTAVRLFPQENGIDTIFVAEKGSVLNLHSREKQAIFANAEGARNKVHFEARNQGTVINATSNSNNKGSMGATISLCGFSDNSSTDKKSLTQVSDGAKINIHSLGMVKDKRKAQPAMINQVTDSSFYVEGNGSELNLISEGEFDAGQDQFSSGYGATLRFRLVGGQKFLTKDKGKVTVKKNYGTASGVRLYGQKNQFLVKSGGNISVNNQADKSSGGGALDGINVGGKQGVQFTVDGSGKDSIFSLEGTGSEVYIKSELGPSLWSQQGNLRFLIGKSTIFRAEGTTKSKDSGIIQSGGTADFEIDQPRFYDLRNNRPNGGQVFTSNDKVGTMEASKSYLSVWEIQKNLDLDKDPDKWWAPISYKLTGKNFEKIVSTDYADEFNNSTYKGANFYSRMSGNGAPPTVDELRVPTNADKTIYGHASVNVGYGDEMRDAWEDEVLVTVQVKRDKKVILEKEVPTKGMNNNLPGIQQWDEDKARGGIFMVELDDFLRTGDVVEVTKAHRGRKGVPREEEEKILVKPVTTVDVTPPQKLTVAKDSLAKSSENITNATKQINGIIDLYDTRDEKMMDEVYVFAKIDNKYVKESIVKVTSEGKKKGDSIANWTINLPMYVNADSQVEIFAKDRSEIGELQNKDKPVTHSKDPNDLWGNLMPTANGYEKYKGYHDAVKTSKKDERFKPSTLLKVEDIVPEGLTILADPVKSNTTVKDSDTNTDKEVTKVGSRLTYSGKIRSESNSSNATKTIQNVFAEIVIPDQLDGDELDFTFKKKKISESDDKAIEITGKYDPVTRILTTGTNKIDISTDDELLFSFNSTVTSSVEGSKSFSLVVKAQGKSIKEDPFVSGDLKPENQITLSTEVAMQCPDVDDTPEPPVIEDGNGYVRLSVVNKRLIAYYRNVNKIVIKIDGDHYKTYTPQLTTAEKSIILDIPIDQHRRNITAEYYYPDPNNANESIREKTSWNKDKWNNKVNDALKK